MMIGTNLISSVVHKNSDLGLLMIYDGSKEYTF